MQAATYGVGELVEALRPLVAAIFALACCAAARRCMRRRQAEPRDRPASRAGAERRANEKQMNRQAYYLKIAAAIVAHGGEKLKMCIAFAQVRITGCFAQFCVHGCPQQCRVSCCPGLLRA
jgi:uncharacterized MAPEG superfamily protein